MNYLYYIPIYFGVFKMVGITCFLLPSYLILSFALSIQITNLFTCNLASINMKLVEYFPIKIHRSLCHVSELHCLLGGSGDLRIRGSRAHLSVWCSLLWRNIDPWYESPRSTLWYRTFFLEEAEAFQYIFALWNFLAHVSWVLPLKVRLVPQQF